MNFWIQQLLMSDAPATVTVFLITGILVYFVDVKQFEKKQENKREARFSKLVAHSYMWGSLTVLVGLRLLNWLS